MQEEEEVEEKGQEENDTAFFGWPPAPDLTGKSTWIWNGYRGIGSALHMQIIPGLDNVYRLLGQYLYRGRWLSD